MITLAAHVLRIHRGELTEEAAAHELRGALAALEPMERIATEQRLLAELAERMRSDDTNTSQPPARILAGARFTHAAAVEVGWDDPVGRTAYVAAVMAVRADETAVAIAYYDEAIRLLDRDAGARVLAREGLVYALVDHGELRRAHVEAERWLADSRASGLRAPEATALSAAGVIADRRGRPLEALELHRSASVLAAALDDPDRDGHRHCHLPEPWQLGDRLGRAARKLGRFEEAMLAYRGALADCDAAGDLRALALLLSEIGFTFELAGEPERGADYLQRATTLARELGRDDLADHWDPRRRAQPVEDLTPTALDAPAASAYRASRAAATALRGGSDSDHVIDALVSLVDWAQHARDVQLELTARTNHVAAVASPFRAALKARAVAKLARKVGDPLVELHNQTNFVVLSADLGAPGRRAGLEVAAAALAAYAELIATTTSSEIRQQLRARQAHLVEAYAALLHAAGSDQPLVELYEQARARNLVTWLRRRDAATGELRDRLRELQRLEVETEAMHCEPEVAHDALRENRARRDALVATLPAWTPRVATAIDELTAIVRDRPGSAVLYLFGTGDVVLATVARFERGALQLTTRAVTWPRDERLAHVGHLLGTRLSMSSARGPLVSAGDRGTRDVIDRPASRTPPFDQLVAEVAARLAPLGELLTGVETELAIVAHRELALLPFELVLAAPDGPYVMTLSPSISVLHDCLARGAGGEGSRLVIGDPTSTLPHAAREARLHGDDVVTPADLDDLAAAAQGAALLHVPAHGTFDAANPYRSGLVIFPGAWPAGPTRGPGRLTVLDILSRIDLPRAPLVILSACDSGVSRLHAADEQTGLPAAFLIAGARAVIATTSRVRDDVAYLIVDELLRSRAGPARALADARRAVRAMSRAEVIVRLGTDLALPEGDVPFAPPSFTAAFHCYGAW